MARRTKQQNEARSDAGAVTVAELARLLSAAGGEQITAKMIRRDLAAGAPVTESGKVNLLHYAAWLVKGLTR